MSRAEEPKLGELEVLLEEPLLRGVDDGRGSEMRSPIEGGR